MAHEEQEFIDGWATYSEWIDDLRDDSDVIADCDDDQDFKDGLMACDTNLERFKFIWSNNELRKELRKYYQRDLAENSAKCHSRKGKSIQESKKMRDLGNKSFKDGRHHEALEFYTQAIRLAPYPDDEQDDSMALALANRSAALYALKRYRMCLTDIDLALKFGYPEANHIKLQIRRLKCLHVLSVWANDSEEIKSKMRRMLSDPATKEFIKTEISNMFEFLETSQPQEMEKDELDYGEESLAKTAHVHRLLPNAADCVEMSYQSDRGRSLILNNGVSFGRILISEEPYVCNLAPSKRDQYCHNCLGRLFSCGLGCKKCTQILYCSLKCVEANLDLHSYECNGFLDFQTNLGVAYLVTQILFKINFDPKPMATHTKKTDMEKSLDEILEIPISNWPDLVYKNDYPALLSLMDHASDYDYDSMMGYTLTAAYIVTAFKDQFRTKFPNDEQSQLVLGSLILRHLLQLQTNLISILDQDLSTIALHGHALSELHERPIGVGLYPTVSLMNHSCGPNILSIFHKNRFIARAASSIECGSEINYCYGPSISRMSKIDRKTRLKEQYFFDCECNFCVNNIENEARALVCPNCGGPVIYNRDLTHQCLKCKVEGVLDVQAALTNVEQIQTKLDELRESEINDALQVKRLEERLSKIIYWKNPIFVRIKSQLIECAEAKDDISAAIQYCREEMELSDKTHGESSLESIMTKFKFINLDWQRLQKQFDNAVESSQRELVPDIKQLIASIQSTRSKLKDLLNATHIIGAEASFDQELKFLSDIQHRLLAQLNRLE